jgi:hypothetical protein
VRHRSALLSLLVACLLGGAPCAAAAAAPGATSPAVVLIGVPDLRWEDLSPGTTPALWRLATTSSVGTMTDRSGETAATRRATGWVTLGSGSRAVTGLEAGAVPDPVDPQALQALRTANEGARYQSQVGTLGDALHRAGLTVAAVGGPGALLGAMTRDGTVDARASAPTGIPAGADVVMVELPELYVAGRADPAEVQRALGAIDGEVAAVLQELPEGAALLLAGTSDGPTGRPHLHVAMAAGPSFGPGLLTSASTGRDGVVQLIDVAPTVLRLTGAATPPAVLGTAWHEVAGGGAPTRERVAAFVDLDQRSRTQQATVRWYYPVVAWTALLFVTGASLAWAAGRTRLLRPVGAVVAAVPVAGYLAQIVPWWRAGTWPLAPLTAGIAVLIGLGAAAVTRRRMPRWGTAAVVGGGTALVVLADAATGSPLSLDGVFADNPIIAGRFHGIGNVAFALLGAGTLLLSAALAAHRPPRRAAATVTALGGLAVLVDGLPFLGDDFGGVLALVPAVAVLALTVSRTRVAVRHLAAVAATAVIVTAAFAFYDYSRPASRRTHLGRFVGQLGDGSAVSVVRRKMDTSLGTFTGGWARWIVVAWAMLAVVAWIAFRRGLVRVPADVDPHTARGLLAALIVLAFLGAALNDSGAEIPAFAFYLALPLLVPLLEPVPAPARPAPAEPVAGSATGVPP